MQVYYKGLIKEKLPSGNVRYRVRMKGDKATRISLPIEPDHPRFNEYYNAARLGQALPRPEESNNVYKQGSLGWLIKAHLNHVEQKVQQGLLDVKTLKKRKQMLRPIQEHYANYSANMPSSAIVQIRDALSDRPAWADDTVAALRQVFSFGVERNYCQHNPAIGISNVYRSKGGATPWTRQDIEQYFIRHPIGTPPHLCLSILLYTACRIGDALHLGADNVFTRDGVKGIQWKAQKSNASSVAMPMLPALQEAIKAAGVEGCTPFMRVANGNAYSSADSLGQIFKKWCKQAGLPHLSAHGVRKGVGAILAEIGCTNYQIMAIHGHTESRTSGIYTKAANRWGLSFEAMVKMEEKGI